jgi:hypothetical protein
MPREPLMVRFERDRAQHFVVLRYLCAVRGQQYDVETPADQVRRQLRDLDAQLITATGLERMVLMQQQFELRELAMVEQHKQVQLHEDDFVACAKAYGERKRITYEAWRRLGVSPSALKRAGIAP